MMLHDYTLDAILLGIVTPCSVAANIHKHIIWLYLRIWSTENAVSENEGPMRNQIDQRPTDTTGKLRTKFPG